MLRFSISPKHLIDESPSHGLYSNIGTFSQHLVPVTYDPVTENKIRADDITRVHFYLSFIRNETETQVGARFLRFIHSPFDTSPHDVKFARRPQRWYF